MTCRACGASSSSRWNGRECWECSKKRVAKWKRDNRVRNRAYHNAEAVRYYARHPAEIKHRCATRRARLRALGRFSRAEWEAIKERQGGRCIDCREPKTLTMGHLIPISRNGPHAAANIVGQCRSCNSRQGTNIHPLAVEAAA